MDLRSTALPLALLCLTGCSAQPPVVVPVPTSGTRVRVGGQTGPLGHASEAVLDGDLIYVADANGLPIVRWPSAEELELVFPLGTARIAHCASLALHAASHTLLCTSNDVGLDALIDVSDPTFPVARLWPAFETPDPVYAVPDVAIEGDVAWLAAHDDGLLRAPLGPDGTPTALEWVPSGTAVLAVAVLDGGRVAYLDREQGVVVLDAVTYQRLGSAPIAGPPIGMSEASGRLLVALGSEGMASYRIDPSGAPILEQTVVPRCVVTDADRVGDALAVSCLTGVMLYDLRGTSPRLASYFPAGYGVLDLALDDRGLLVVDWYDLVRYEVDLDASPAVPEAPRGMRLRPGDPAHVPLRNPGEEPLDVHYEVRTAGGTTLTGDLLLGPHETQTVDVPATSIAGETTLVIERDGLRAVTQLRPRTEAERPSDGDVAIGDPFPVLSPTTPEAAPLTIPNVGVACSIVFLTVDCFLQWPQLEDMAWLRAHGDGIAEPTIVYLTTFDMDPFEPYDFLGRYGATGLRVVEWADYVAGIPAIADEPIPSIAFDHSFSMPITGADFPHDYHVDAAGVTTATSRAYRGRWPLGE